MVASSITVTPARHVSHSDEVLCLSGGSDKMLFDFELYFDLEPSEMRIGMLAGGADRLQGVSVRPCCKHDADPARITRMLELMQERAAAVAAKLD